MKQYIITEDMLRQWRKGCTNVSGSYCACKKCEYCGTGLRKNCCDFDDNAMEDIFRSHPYQSERGDCNSMGCCEFCNKDGCWYLSAICKKKRDKVLDKVEKAISHCPDRSFCLQKIEKLRQAGE